MLKKIIKKRAYEGNKIEDNLLFVTLQTQIVGLDMNNGYEQIFLSDKLSNMCNFYYDKDTKQLLVYNTSGHAYLYQMPEGKRLSQKLYLRAMDLQPDSIAHKGDYYWYSDTNFCLRRLDIKDGSTKQILKDKERRVVNVIQVADRLYIFTDMRREIEGYVKILCYHIDENGDLKYEFEWGERPYVFMGYVRRDFDRKTVIVGAKTYTKYVGDYYVAFDKHYKAEVAELMEKGLTKEEAEAQSPLMLEAREMLRKWEANDPEVRALWKKMNEWVYAGFDETYRMMGVSFDKIYYESDTYLEGKEKVMEGLEKGFFFRKEDGSVWADLTAEGLDHKLLLRGDGTSVYMTQDIGTAKLRFQDYPINKMIYVVGNEQNYHFQVLSILLDKLGFEWGKSLVHFSYGMVELPEGKMKSREGTVVDADDLMEEMIATAKETSQELGKLDGLTQEEADDIARIVGLGALKYFILKVDARKNMTFNPKESIDFNGNTGPFIQYTYARIQSILRKAAEAGLTIPAVIPAGIELSTKEEGLIQMLADFTNVVKQAGSDYNPSILANYTYDLVKEYNQFYHDFSILREENEAVKVFRLALSQNVGKVVKLAMGLLGIEVPERM